MSNSSQDWAQWQKHCPCLRPYIYKNGTSSINSISLAPGRYGTNFENTILILIKHNSSLGTPSEIALKWLPQNITNGSGNGLVLVGIKPLPEPMFVQIYLPIWHH